MQKQPVALTLIFCLCPVSSTEIQLMFTNLDINSKCIYSTAYFKVANKTAELIVKINLNKNKKNISN